MSNKSNVVIKAETKRYIDLEVRSINADIARLQELLNDLRYDFEQFKDATEITLADHEARITAREACACM